jgi:hypothetical protein
VNLHSGGKIVSYPLIPLGSGEAGCGGFCGRNQHGCAWWFRGYVWLQNYVWRRLGVDSWLRHTCLETDMFCGHELGGVGSVAITTAGSEIRGGVRWA